MNRVATVISITFCTLAAGCASTPETVSELEEARSAVRTLESQPKAQTVASAQLADAERALSSAEALLEDDRALVDVKHEAYVARRHAEIGMEVITEAEALERIEKAEAERQGVLLQARTQEAERAKSLAEERARQATQSEQEAQRALAVADAAIDEAKRLADELSEMEAEETERGLVLTLGDVLFDTNRAEIKSGASRTMDRLAEYLDNNPERRLLVEGHTDARGSSEYNEDLSARRADAVVEALVERGIDPDRLRSEGLGEAFPVASNDTDAGMQQNRRVEIVVSDRNGEFVSAGNRAGVNP